MAESISPSLIAALQTLATTITVSIAVFLIQKYFQRKEEYIKEKNKVIANKAVDYETAIFNLIKGVTSNQNLPQADFITVSNNINTLRQEHYIYIDKKINKIAQEFADYCLNVNISLSNRTRFSEQEWLDDFKKHFKK